MSILRKTTISSMMAAALIAANIRAARSTGATGGHQAYRILQRHDLSTPGREAIQVRVDIAPGKAFPGIPISAKRSSTCSKARWSTILDGKPPVTLKAGDVLFIPAGTIHAAKNSGTVPAA